MSTGRGRWNLYQKLKSDGRVAPNLLETEMFNEDSFHTHLQHQVVIRPCFGQMEITISSVGGEKYSISYRNVSVTISGKTNVFTYIKDICKTEKYYIIQGMNFLNKVNCEMVEVYVSIQKKKPLKWYISSIDEKNCLLQKKEIKAIKKRIKEIALNSAKALENSLPDVPTVVLSLGITPEKIWIGDIHLHYSKSKWSQHQVFLSSRKLSRHIPSTKLAAPLILFDYIETYKQVMLKPCSGQWGLGILQISWLKDNEFEVHTEKTKIRLYSKKELLDYLENHFFSRDHYLVQERIALATIEESVIDFRVMVQREFRTSKWKITGILAKVASKNFVVTNVARLLMPLDKALEKAGILNRFPNKISNKLQKVCLKTAKLIGKYYTNADIIGMDVGIDGQGRIWIIETNLSPDITLFKKLEDKSMYEKIKGIRKRAKLNKI